MFNSPSQNFSSNQDSQQFSALRESSSFFAKVLFSFGLAVMLSATGTYVGFHYLSELFLTSQAYMWIFLAIEIILVLTARVWSTYRPLNYLLFGIFAFVTGITIVPLLVSIILEFGGPNIIIKAFLATTLAFTATAIFSWTTHRNLSGLRGFLTISLIGMVVVSLIGLFIPWGNNFEIVFSGLGVIIFSGYTMYDIQRLKNYPSDRYIDAALMLYLDIFNLFIYILRLVAGLSRNR